MGNIRLKFENILFSSVDEMVTILLNETNEQIVRIDLGEKDNNVEERNYAKFRLMHIQRTYSECVPEQYRGMYNSLWSQLYRLEHQGDYVNPYLKQLIQKIKNG